MSGNTRGWIEFSSPGEGKICDIVLSSKKRGWGNSKFCKIADGNHGDTTGIPRDFYRGLEMTLLRTGNELAHTSQNGVGQNGEKEIYSVP